MNDWTWALAILAASGLIAASSVGYFVAFAVYRRVWGWRATRRRLKEMGR